MKRETDRVAVSAVMPCLNEEMTLGICIQKALTAFQEMGINGEVVIADNGSTDNSIEIAKENGARVIHVEEKGYGSALRAGIEAAEGDIIIMADSDDSYNWRDLKPFVDKVNQGYDLVMGNRFKGGIAPGAMPWHHKYIGNPVLSTLAKIAFRIPVGDFHCGLRAFTKEAYRKLNLKSSGMEFATEMVAHASRAGLNVTEIPTTLDVDGRDRAPHLRSFRDGWRHLKFILTYAPDHLFLIPGGLLFAIGLFMVFFLSTGPVTVGSMYFGIHFLVLASLMTLIGYSTIWIGILAKSILKLRFAGTLESKLLMWMNKHFYVGWAVFIGGFMFISGLFVNIAILMKWIIVFGGQPMETTIHPAISASTIMALGVMTIFNSFLFALHEDVIHTDKS